MYNYEVPDHACCAWLTRDGRWSTYDVSVHKLYNVSFRGKFARRGQPLNLPSLTKLAWPDHFPPDSQEGRLAGPVFYSRVYVFSLSITRNLSLLRSPSSRVQILKEVISD
jgi:hypothetical protein